MSEAQTIVIRSMRAVPGEWTSDALASLVGQNAPVTWNGSTISRATVRKAAVVDGWVELTLDVADRIVG